MASSARIHAGIVAFSSMDLTDFSSPIETLSHVRDTNRNRKIEVTIISEHDQILTSQNVVLGSHIGFQKAQERLHQFDILIIPGSSYNVVKDQLSADNAIIKLIHAFATLAPRPTDEAQRILMSVCSGAFFLGYAGVLKSRSATTHYSILQELKETSSSHGETTVLRKRYVDGGLLPNGIRVITSGGITSGFDVALYAIEIMFSKGDADHAADIMDYAWRRSEGFLASP